MLCFTITRSDNLEELCCVLEAVFVHCDPSKGIEAAALFLSNRFCFLGFQ